mgnify:CR=1 FL=1
MSGLDGLGWPNPEDEPKQNKTMNSQLEIKLAPTPESDKAKIDFTSLFANDDACWIPYAIGKKLERERDAAQKERDKLAEALRKIKNAGGNYTGGNYIDPYDELDFIDGVTFEALESIKQNEP